MSNFFFFFVFFFYLRESESGRERAGEDDRSYNACAGDHSISLPIAYAFVQHSCTFQALLLRQSHDDVHGSSLVGGARRGQKQQGSCYSTWGSAKGHPIQKLSAQVHYGKLGDVDSEGDWVLTVFTTLSTVLRLLELYPSHIAVIFDHTGLTFRHTLFPAYKGNRPPTPDTLQQGLHYIKPALLAMAMKVIEVPGVEADDVIGTLALTAVAAGMKVRIASPDKDFFQILSSELRLLRFVPRGSGIVSFGIEEFAQRYGNLKPSQFVDVMALVGDKVDNIPGVVGIGEKTAIQLISQYGSLEKVLEERNDVTIQRARKCLLEEKGEALLSKRLVALRADLPSYMIPYSLKDLSLQKPDDGGENFFQLLKAMASYVDGPYFNDLQQRSLDFWKKV
ncbi:hypothetical protein O6H91_12G004000 [Diphasiastrum complanatum]|uniref:Uncharacterized protein n=1 Tax=Diphasiastrum complanatum TaxID=34168 RepID=A0ACC2BYV4_DIPCM|nr:hypothetical protein O6H91_12G004000 [Diphasiastrum complanatum]